MRRLHVVGFTTDLDGLIFSTRKGSKSGSFFVPIGDELQGKLDEVDRLRNGADAPGLGSGAASSASRAPRRDDPPRPRVESELTPREIQTRLRAGRTIDEVAREARVDREWVERFAAPILAEQAKVVDQAKSLVYAKARLGDSTLPLGEAVAVNLVDKGVRFLDEDFDRGWSAFQLHDAVWMVIFEYHSRGRLHQASWEVDLAARHLTSRDRQASDLGYVEPGRRLRSRLTEASDEQAAAQVIASREAAPLRPSRRRPRPPARNTSRATAKATPAARSRRPAARTAKQAAGAKSTASTAKATMGSASSRTATRAKATKSTGSAKPAEPTRSVKPAKPAKAGKAAKAAKAGKAVGRRAATPARSTPRTAAAATTTAAKAPPSKAPAKAPRRAVAKATSAAKASRSTRATAAPRGLRAATATATKALTAGMASKGTRATKAAKGPKAASLKATATRAAAAKGTRATASAAAKATATRAAKTPKAAGITKGSKEAKGAGATKAAGSTAAARAAKPAPTSRAPRVPSAKPSPAVEPVTAPATTAEAAPGRRPRIGTDGSRLQATARPRPASRPAAAPRPAADRRAPARPAPARTPPPAQAAPAPRSAERPAERLAPADRPVERAEADVRATSSPRTAALMDRIETVRREPPRRVYPAAAPAAKADGSDDDGAFVIRPRISAQQASELA